MKDKVEKRGWKPDPLVSEHDRRTRGHGLRVFSTLRRTDQKGRSNIDPNLISSGVMKDANPSDQKELSLLYDSYTKGGREHNLVFQIRQGHRVLLQETVNPSRVQGVSRDQAIINSFFAQSRKK